ncbi:MAG: flagellar basal body protein [Pirellulales bacterium]
MIGNLFDGTTIPALEQVVAFTQARHNVLAGNVANMDTPGYRVRDLSPTAFQERLKEAITVGRSDESMSTRGEYTEDREAAMEEVRQSMHTLLYHDDSNDSLETQVNELNKNLGQHNLAISILRSQFALLQTAISQRV